MSAENKDVDKETLRKKLPITYDKKTQLPLWRDVRTLTLNYTISVGKIFPFFEKLAEGKILAIKCKHCGELYFPPQVDCPKCRKSEVDWIELSGEGELETYTLIKIKPQSFSHYDDYVIAIGRLKEGVRVLAWLRVDDISKIHIGMKIKLVVSERLPESYLVYEFVPAEE